MNQAECFDDAPAAVTVQSFYVEKPSPTLIAGETTGDIIGSFYDVHGALGFGYRELIYAAAMERDLRAKGYHVDRQVPVMVYFRSEPLAKQLLDMVVDRKVVVEVQSTEALRADPERQLFGYLCSTTLEVGLLLHFGRRAGFHRVVCKNRFKRFSQPPEEAIITARPGGSSR